MQALQRSSWPGNIRELQSVLKLTLLQTQGSALVAAHLSHQVRTCLDETLATTAAFQNGDLALDLFIPRAIESGAGNL